MPSAHWREKSLEKSGLERASQSEWHIHCYIDSAWALLSRNFTALRFWAFFPEYVFSIVQLRCAQPNAYRFSSFRPADDSSLWHVRTESDTGYHTSVCPRHRPINQETPLAMTRTIKWNWDWRLTKKKKKTALLVMLVHLSVTSSGSPWFLFVCLLLVYLLLSGVVPSCILSGWFHPTFEKCRGRRTQLSVSALKHVWSCICSSWKWSETVGQSH